MSTLAFELLLRFLWGSLLILTLVSRRETSERFPRIASYIALGTATFAAYLLLHNPQAQREKLFALIALVGGSFLYAFLQARIARVAGFLLMFVAPFPLLALEGGWQYFNFISSALLLGSVFASQYLGHWFLTVPNLSLREFQKIVKIIFLGIVLKGIDTVVCLSNTESPVEVSAFDEMGRPRSPDLTQPKAIESLGSMSATLGVKGESYFGLGFFGLIILAARVLWGLIAPLILAIMIKRTVDMRSTQSATGILYALSVMLIVGEGAALYLNQILGWHL